MGIKVQVLEILDRKMAEAKAEIDALSEGSEEPNPEVEALKAQVEELKLSVSSKEAIISEKDALLQEVNSGAKSLAELAKALDEKIADA